MFDYDCPKCGHTMRLDNAALGGVWRCRSCETIIVLPESLEPVRKRSARPVSASESGLFDRLEGSDFTETAGLSGLFDRPASASHPRSSSESGLLDRSAALSGVIQTEPEEQLARVSQAQRRPLPPPRSTSGSGAMVAVAVVAMVIIFGLIVALLATNRGSTEPANVAKNNVAPQPADQTPKRNLSMADYRGAIPDADNDFLIEMMNKDTSLDEAKAEWAHRLKAAMARRAANPEPVEPPAPTLVGKAPTLIPAPEPKPATTIPDASRRELSLEELRAAFPQADDDFLIAQMRRNRNIDEARAAWGRKLRGEPEPIEVVKRPTPAPAATVVPPRNATPTPTPEPKPAPVAVATPKPTPAPTAEPVVISKVEIAKLHANAVKLMEQLRRDEARYRLQQSDPDSSDPTVRGRYVNIDLPNGKIVNGKKILALAEVQVFSGAVNIAPNGKATQSSTYEESVARLAIDNNTSGDLERDRTVAHTLGEADPRWELDLGADTEITAISIWNRTDNHSDRLDGYRITVLDKSRQPVWQVNVHKAPPISTRFELYNEQGLASKAQMVSAGNPPRDGLVGYWKLDGSAADDSGNDRGGLFKGDPSLAEAKIGSGSITLDGRDDHIVIGKAMGLPTANQPQSIALWYMVPSNPRGNTPFQAFVGMGNDPAASAVMMGFGPSGRLSVWKHDNTPLVQTTSTPDAGSWQHVVYTFDGSTHRLFINGLEKATSTWEANTAAPTHLHLGCWHGRTHFFNGRLDDVMIYNRALTLAEIAAIVQARPEPKPDNARLARGLDNAPISRTDLERLRAEAEAAKQAWLKARADAERAEKEANPPAEPEFPGKTSPDTNQP